MGADSSLIQIVDAALAEAARKSGAWLLCRPGCASCCLGPFPINEVDAARLQRGMEDLAVRDSARFAQILQRAVQFGDGDDEPCPALDPETATCSLYEARPLTCRLFGPPLRGSGGIVGVCELCFEGAGAEDIASCATDVDDATLEALGDGQESCASVAQALLRLTYSGATPAEPSR